ncbi:MAG: hypothetical protein M3134_00215 [Actinomycetota bacterium]|nr:hypothetical protein [Actinomycetota bacterium]
MNTVLIVVTLVEVLLLVVVLAGYLIAIGTTLHRISKTLGLVTFGVRAIESQTAPIGPSLTAVNGALEQVAGALEEVVGEPETATSVPEGEGVESSGDLPRPTTP